MNVFDLFAKISLDTSSYEKGLTSAKSRMSRFGDWLKGALGKSGDVFSSFAKGAAKSLAVVGTGVSAAGTALTGLAKKSLEAYADYEQLEGGVKKIFGEETAKTVMKNANEAFSAAGLSANAYMETVTGFSASLLQSLDGDTEKAAEAANRAIIDMADNVNTYGTSMESVQNAYQGFAKQNYTMLDNLKLGYGGTKEEMQRLITDAAGMNEEMQKLGVTVDADSLSFGNIVNAISVMQEHMNIAGTTSKEAATTISGSIASAKAAWQNFLTGSGSAKQFTDALKIAAENVKAKAKDIVPGMIEGLTAIGDELTPEIPGLIEDLLPVVIDGSSNLLSGLAERAPDLVKTLLPSLASGTVDVTAALVNELPELISALKDTAPIVVKTIMEKKGDLKEAGKELLGAVFPASADDIPEIAASSVSLITKFGSSLLSAENLKKVNSTSYDILNALVNGLTSDATLDAVFDAETGAPKIIENLGGALTDFAINLVDSARLVIKNLGDYLNDEENRKQLQESAKQILIKIGKGLTSQEAKDAVGGLVVEAAKFLADTFIGGIDWDASGAEIAQKIISGLFERLKEISFINLGENISSYIADSLGEKIENNPLLNPQVIYAERDKPKFDPSQLVGLEMDAYNNAHKHSTGFLATRPTWLTNNIVGENGAEALLPLENNTGWMDKLADKLGSKMNGSGDIYITINAPTGNADDIVNAIDEAFRNRQIAQDRSTGGTGWK